MTHKQAGGRIGTKRNRGDRVASSSQSDCSVVQRTDWFLPNSLFSFVVGPWWVSTPTSRCIAPHHLNPPPPPFAFDTDAGAWESLEGKCPHPWCLCMCFSFSPPLAEMLSYHLWISLCDLFGLKIWIRRWHTGAHKSSLYRSILSPREVTRWLQSWFPRRMIMSSHQVSIYCAWRTLQDLTIISGPWVPWTCKCYNRCIWLLAVAYVCHSHSYVLSAELHPVVRMQEEKLYPPSCRPLKIASVRRW